MSPGPTHSRAPLRRLLAGTGAAALAVVATRRAARARREMSRLRILDQVSSTADGSLSLDETLTRITEAVVPAFADICMVDAINEGDVHRIAVRAKDPDGARIEAAIRRRTPSTPEWLRDPGSQSLEPLLVPDMTEAVLRDMAEDEEDLEFLRWLGARSYVVAPLVSRGRRLGTLTVVQRDAGLGGEDVRFVSTLASRIGVALDNAGLFSDLESVERRMDSVLANVSEAVIVHNGNGHLVFANASASDLLGLGEGEGEDLVSGRPGPADARFELRDEAGKPLARESLPRHRVLRGEDSEPMVFELIDHETGAESWRLERSNPITGPDGSVLYVVTTIEDVTAVKQAEFGQRVLASSAEAIASATDFAGALEALAQAVVPEIADWCAVSVPNDEGTIERLATSDPDPEMIALDERLRAGLQVRAGMTLSMADVLRASKPVTAELPDEPLPGWVLLKPIRPAGVDAVEGDESPRRQAIGILTLVNRAGRRAFSAEEIRLARAVADRAGVAVLNSKLAGERAKIAETLQRELLPPLLPQVEGWSMAAMYRPAGEQNRAGGDFYDVFEGPEGWVVMLGDVEGHGPEAAALTARARYTIRTAAMINGDIQAAFAILNRQLRARERPRLCSVLCVTFGGGPEAKVVSAGHPLPLQVSDGTVREVGLPGSLLGALEEPQWSPVRISVERGEELIMYTDGVVEARRNGERFGRERLGSLVRRIGDPAATVQRIGEAIDEFGELVNDDAAMVVLRRDRDAAFRALQLTPQTSQAAE